MAYDENIRELRYRSPSGATFTLQVDDVERSGGKKAAIHEFPQQNKADVQDLGNQARRFPLSVYFTGADYDTAADSFMAALEETGPGALQHATFGDIPVLPLTWSETRKLVEGLGRSDFKVEFIEVQAQVTFPITTVAADAAVSATVAAADAEFAAQFEAEFAPANAEDVASVKAAVLDNADGWDKIAAKVAAKVEEIAAEFDAAQRELEAKIDSFMDAPASLFASTSKLMRIPAKVTGSIAAKVNAYSGQIKNAVLAVPRTYAEALNFFCNLLGFSAGAALAAVTASDNPAQPTDVAVRSRGDAVAIADTLAEISEITSAAIEAAESAVPGFRPSPVAVAGIMEAITTAKASMLERSFSLRAERRVLLETERTPLDLIAEFYGNAITDIDAALDDFIVTNGLEGDEIILVPAGREVVYYA